MNFLQLGNCPKQWDLKLGVKRKSDVLSVTGNMLIYSPTFLIKVFRFRLCLERPKIVFRVMTALPVLDIDDFFILGVVIL